VSRSTGPGLFVASRRKRPESESDCASAPTSKVSSWLPQGSQRTGESQLNHSTVPVELACGGSGCGGCTLLVATRATGLRHSDTATRNVTQHRLSPGCVVPACHPQARRRVRAHFEVMVALLEGWSGVHRPYDALRARTVARSPPPRVLRRLR
jgi:hypothetical protein